MSIASIGEALENPSVTQLLAAYPTKEAFDAAVQSGKIKPTTEAGVAANIFNRIVQSALANQAQAQAQTTVFQDNTQPQTPPQMGLAAAAAQPQMPQRPGQGLDQVPVPLEMFDERRMAGGGIVAFQPGGAVPSFAGMYENLSPDIEALRSVLGAYPIESPEEKARRRKEEQAIRLMEIGLGVAGGESPYFASNLKGALPGLRGAAEDIRAQRKEDVAMQMAQRAETGKLLEGVLGTRGKAAESAAAADRLKTELASRESIAQADREARSAEGVLDRASREAIANIPPKELQAAAILRKDNPELSYLDSIKQASEALSPKDTYNSTRNALTKAGEAVTDRLKMMGTIGDPEFKKLFNAITKGSATEAEKAAYKKIRDKIEEEVFTLYQVQNVDLSTGKMILKGAQPSATGATRSSPTGVTTPPQGAIDALKLDPSLAAQFDAKYGAGAAAIYLGR